MSKKNKNKINKSYSGDSDELYGMLKVLAGVVIALVAFYFVAGILTGEISFNDKKEEKVVEVQNIEILAGSTFNRIDDSYYVMFYDFSATDSVSYANIYDIYVNTTTDKMYLVDLNKGFNKGYIIEDKSKVNVKDVNSLKVVNGTLVKVEKGVGVSYTVGYSDIQKVLFDSKKQN